MPARSCAASTCQSTWLRHRTTGVSKPDPGFFQELVNAVPYPASEILYVGDRLDIDIRPAADVGMRTALIRRGPWGVVQEHEADADRLATLRIGALAELPARLATLNA